MDVRPSPIAGTWYPGHAKALTKSLDQYLATAPTRPEKQDWFGVIVPHAGWRYSGRVAGSAFNGLRNLRPDVIAIVGPFHYQHSAGLLTTAHDAYQTPLGLVPVDQDALSLLDQSLKNALGHGLTRIRHDPEHSIEIELPFLQHVIGTFRLLPIMMVDQGPRVAEALGHALARLSRAGKTLLVASSDLSHFYPQASAEKLDAELLRRVERFDPRGVLDAEEDGVGFACGRGAIAAALWAARDWGANWVTVLQRATSGPVTGDYSSVVGYGAAAIWRERGATQ